MCRTSVVKHSQPKHDTIYSRFGGSLTQTMHKKEERELFYDDTEQGFENQAHELPYVAHGFLGQGIMYM